MKTNVFGFSFENIIYLLDLPRGRYGYSFPATNVLNPTTNHNTVASISYVNSTVDSIFNFRL